MNIKAIRERVKQYTPRFFSRTTVAEDEQLIREDIPALLDRIEKLEKALREHECDVSDIESLCWAKIINGKKCTATEILEGK